MGVLVTFKNKEERNKNEDASMKKIRSKLKALE